MLIDRLAGGTNLIGDSQSSDVPSNIAFIFLVLCSMYNGEHKNTKFAPRSSHYLLCDALRLPFSPVNTSVHTPETLSRCG
jgi:hypothetical protein